MPLLANSPSRANYLAINALGNMAATSSVIGTIPAIADSEAATTCVLTATQVASLREKIRQVRAKRLRHVALRGCKIGAWSEVLAYYKPFFGCTSISAPQNRDTYGVMPFEVNDDLTAWTSRWERGHRDNPHTMRYASEQVVVATAGGAWEEHSYDVNAVATSESNKSTWLSTYLGIAPSSNVKYHGQFLTYPVSDCPRIIFIGAPQYRSGITVVS